MLLLLLLLIIVTGAHIILGGSTTVTRNRDEVKLDEVGEQLFDEAVKEKISNSVKIFKYLVKFD